MLLCVSSVYPQTSRSIRANLVERIPASVSRRFWKKARRAQLIPEIPGKKFLKPCLVWTASCDQDGYGIFKAFPGCMGLRSGIVRVHRFAYWIIKGPFPKNAQIHHECENHSCLEIGHLALRGIVEHAAESNVKRWSGLSEEAEQEIIAELEEI